MQTANETRHTPGPWTDVVQTLHDEAVVVEEWRGPHNERRGICSLYGDKESPETKANAKLIAAAPELLAELQNVLRCFERDSVPSLRFSRPMGTGTAVFVTDATAERIREAIAKATT